MTKSEMTLHRHKQAVPERVVLEGVPRVGFWDPEVSEGRCPEDIPFPSCLRAWLEYRGENLGCRHATVEGADWGLGCAYAYLVGTSGTGFFLSWKPGWHGGNLDVRHMSEDPLAPFDHAFASISYAYEYVGKEEYGEDDFRRRIMESIADRGHPVLALGVIGPPECCLVTGYDEGGDVLVGWNYFQGDPALQDDVTFEPSGYFRKVEWFKDTECLILLGEKEATPSFSHVYRDALSWALTVMRTPVTGEDRRNGLMAYEAWADQLLRDADFPDDISVLRQRYMVHNDAVGMVAEGRWYASLFLAHIAQQEWKMAEDLYRAAAYCASEHALMWKVWEVTGGPGYGDEHAEKLADPQARCQIASLILQARDKDARAADHIERALEKEG